MTEDTSILAVDGGAAIRLKPWPQRHNFGAEERQAVLEVMDEAIAMGCGPGYGGETEQAYRADFADFQGGGYAYTVNSGSSAVYVALRALELAPGGEIIVPPTTDPGGVMPVALIGCTPVAADAANGSLNVNVATIEACLTDRTRAIIVVHLSGIPVDMKPIMALARRAGVPVLEDCAQAHGARLHGAMVGTFGDIAAFSTMHTKHHTTGGIGGMVFTRNETLARRVALYADRGKPPVKEIDWRKTPSCRQVATLNFNLGDLPASIGRVQLRKLHDNLARRRVWVTKLAELTAGLSCIHLTTWGQPIDDCAFWFIVLRVDLKRLAINRDRLVELLNAEGIPFYGEDLEIADRSPWFRDRKVFGDGKAAASAPWPQDQPHPNVPNADAAAGYHIALDLHENLGSSEVADAAAALRKVEARLLQGRAA